MVQNSPNKSYVQGKITSLEESKDGWGCWAALEIIQVTPLRNSANWCGDLVGKTITVFAPPPWVNTLNVGIWTGHLTYQSGPFGEGVYSITGA